MASTFAKKHTNYLVSYFWLPFIVFFLFHVIIVIFLSLLSFWVEPYVFPLLRKHFTYKTYQCKFYLTVPEEGWFGQPKYSTPSKISPTLYRTLLLYFYFYLLNRLDHYFDPTYTSRIIVHGYLLKLLIKIVTVAVTVCKSSHGQESYLRVLNGIFISKEYSILDKQKKKPYTKIYCFLKEHYELWR